MESNREVFETYNKDVYRTCYYMVHDAADAEDLCQEVFITVFRSNWQSIDYLKTWIMKITVNACLNHLKRRRSLQHKLADNLHLFQGRGMAKSVEGLIEQKETSQEWVVHLSRLPVKIRAVLTLRYMHDFSLAEVSEALSIPLGTTKSRLHKGLKLMKNVLLEAGMPEEAWKGEPYEATGRCTQASIK
ncbi:RNA polymerase subunit sigma [Paenibacillus helianthi]|uniref:RNA polymerase subunit sigma n=1 Tax=Paenibacillus helianthi TaxID=1349432 RepID=A0ABX3ETA6_9BACL|nr:MULTISPECIES: RNA polymerase sigma factor [Paenibacillus]OKP69560.1 RNA polymerase subunit sigma [Paenibacillus sp. P3E]OKP89981.1 RNA polymerase subunit sigma [Paenibacillus sp. P32E]OKP91176.1 RNA polymerase subunit sigma [Paenibacillus helianthi]